MYSPLTSPQKVTRWLILQKARGQTRYSRSIVLPLLVGTRFQILFHSGHPGSFHLSLTVLVRYRSLSVFSLGEWTPQLPTGLACPVVLKLSDRSLLLFGYGSITLSGRPFQCLSPKQAVFNSFEWMWPLCQRLQPQFSNAHTLTLIWFRLFPVRSPLLGKLSLFLGVLRCFSSPRALRIPMYSVCDTQAFPWVGSPIRISPDQSSLTAPRGFSQPTTSFFGTQRLGIHRMPLLS